MPSNSNEPRGTGLAIGGLAAAMGICCGLPILLGALAAAGGLGALGSVLKSRW